ncbi:hypothetical protein A2856_02550 [Candidatus Uhrbacteria bacterium RIFCSPHIGHO2_01_FULL_63_20]|uniref:Vitamin K epoxide reductase domain-containing protein n=1 Tax=Candidatus Uhrbacteria bacterium RIFCSPHIGHO2_01_FULL_63_20 TaxID=1802385 RepID=A0A1F7TLY1_9BACT|nr:MAG: hypothetical protein A2856_02550 [Candidatus Uhrbacteria bacterium RIFCSPHIGHO2_01_FULL_63_20]
MTAYVILFTMAAFGIAETSYLIRTRKANKHATCPIGGGCATVLESKYNALFGFHNDILGLAFYLAMALVTALTVIGVEPIGAWTRAATWMVAGALVMSAAFTLIQWRILKAWCFWCLMSAGTVLVMAVTLVL